MLFRSDEPIVALNRAFAAGVARFPDLRGGAAVARHRDRVRRVRGAARKGEAVAETVATGCILAEVAVAFVLRPAPVTVVIVDTDVVAAAGTGYTKARAAVGGGCAAFSGWTAIAAVAVSRCTLPFLGARRPVFQP